MEITNIFESQCKFIDLYEKIYKENYDGKPRKERLKFFIILNSNLSNFFHNYINPNIWEPQRAIYFSFWIGLFYIKNCDCITEIEKLMNFSELYCPFSKIIAMRNNRVRRLILNSQFNESNIIFEKMREFKKEYYFLESNVNRLIKFFLMCRQKNLIKKCSLSIKILRHKLPDDIVINIIKNLESDNDYKIKYIKYKRDIDMIMEQCGLGINDLKYIYDVYSKNNQDIVNSILEIIGCD